MLCSFEAPNTRQTPSSCRTHLETVSGLVQAVLRKRRQSTQSRRRQVGVLRFFRRVGTKLLYLVQGPFLSTTHPSRASPTPHGPPGADEDTAISPQRRDPLRCRADSGARWRSVDVAGGSRGADSFLCARQPLRREIMEVTGRNPAPCRAAPRRQSPAP